MPPILGVSLLRDGLIAPHALLQALALQKRHNGRLCDILLARNLIDETTLYAAQARHWGVTVADPATTPPDPRLIDRLG
ncbi:MAG: glycosyl transferase, partial [Paracoccaceae bacterium]|nr:glycosyl transferase [Paracoccaceae bacterium]